MFVALSTCVYPAQMCVSRAAPPPQSPPPPSVVLLEEWLLVYGLKCLHGSGPPLALWLSPIDLFQETLEREGGRKSRGGCGEKRVVLLGSRSFLFPLFLTSVWNVLSKKHPSMQRFYTKDSFPL